MIKFSLADVFSSIERLENAIPVEGLSNRIRFGEHKSLYKSDGYDFDQIREYDPEEDSIFDIMWNFVGFDGKLFVRKARAAKEFVAVIMADISTSMASGVGHQAKERMLLESVGNIGMTCSHGQDPIGLIGFAEDIIFDEEPRRGSEHTDYLIEELYNFFQTILSDGRGEIDRRKTDFYKAFSFFSKRYADNRCFLVVISDFIGAEEIVNSPILKDVAGQHEVVFVFLDDPAEFKISRGSGYIRQEDIETKQEYIIKRNKLAELELELRKKRKQMKVDLGNLGVDSMVLEYGKNFQRLLRLFMARQESFRV